MYPERQLSALANRKALVRARIAARRWECAAAASELAAGPIAFVDRMIALWRAIPRGVKAVGIPLAVFAVGFMARRVGKARLIALLHVAPAILRTVRLVAERRAAAAVEANLPRRTSRAPRRPRSLSDLQQIP